MSAAKEAICLDRYAGADEARAARRLISELLRCGYAVSVNDGEETTVRQSVNRNEILEAMATTGEDVIVAWRPQAGHPFGQPLPGRESGWERVGWFQLVYQRGPGDELIADYGVNPEAERIADHVASAFE